MPGDIIAGQYQVERLLGTGEMGPVVAARHLERRARVALKLIHTRQATNPIFVERFLRDGGAAIGIHSEHARRIHEVGRLACGTPYLAMEYLDGLDLGTFIRTNGVLTCEAAVTYVLQACDALVDAHARGIVHGDLKPDNLFLIRRDDGSACIKVLGFGIPRMLLPGDAVGPYQHAPTGASPYMSPEQVGSSPDVDARADIWGVGVLLFELLTGRQPFTADTIGEACRKVLEDNPPPLRGEGRQVNAIVQRCLEKKPELRYPSVQELLIALAPMGPAEVAPEGDELPTLASQLRHGPRAWMLLVATGIALSAAFALRAGCVGRRVSAPDETPGPAPAARVPTNPEFAPAASTPAAAVAAAVPAAPRGVEAAPTPPVAQTPVRDGFSQLRAAPRRFSVVNQARRMSARETGTRKVEIPDDRK